jgi:hypothetical protein
MVSQKYIEEQPQILRLTTPNLHPTNDDLFVGTPKRLKSTPGAPFPTPATKTCRRGPRFAQDASNYSLHSGYVPPIEDDLSRISRVHCGKSLFKLIPGQAMGDDFADIQTRLY